MCELLSNPKDSVHYEQKRHDNNSNNDNKNKCKKSVSIMNDWVGSIEEQRGYFQRGTLPCTEKLNDETVAKMKE